MSDESDAKQTLTASPLENWRRPPVHARTTWMKTTQQDLKSMNLSLNEATDVAHQSSIEEIDVYVRRSTLIVVHARNEWVFAGISNIISTLMLRCTFGSSRAPLTSRLDRLRSSTADCLFVAAVRLSIIGRHNFPVAGACIWNDLPSNITSSPSADI